MFEEQLGFLKLSNESFDGGNLAEAKRLAVALRVLFHNTGMSHALLNQLDLRDSLTWVASAGMPDPNNRVTTLGLVQMGMDIGKSQATYRAPLGDRPPIPILTSAGTVPRFSRIDTDLWWTDPVAKDRDGTQFCRKDFVLALANQEGGAHVDPQIRQSYDKIANSNSMGWTYKAGDAPEVPLSNPVPHAVRQISYEVVESVRQQRDRIK